MSLRHRDAEVAVSIAFVSVASSMLNIQLRHAIIELLTPLPAFADEYARRAILFTAGVERLLQHGCTDDPRVRHESMVVRFQKI